MGCFQLYKKKCFHGSDFVCAGFGDYYFGYDNFDLFCKFDNIIYFHLGAPHANWAGKVEDFIHDVNVSLNNIYYKCNKSCNNVYYNKKCEIVQYGNSKNIDDDIWTCSDKMRYDIYDFFKDKSHFKKAEIVLFKPFDMSVNFFILKTFFK